MEMSCSMKSESLSLIKGESFTTIRLLAEML